MALEIPTVVTDPAVVVPGGADPAPAVQPPASAPATVAASAATPAPPEIERTLQDLTQQLEAERKHRLGHQQASVRLAHQKQALERELAEYRRQAQEAAAQQAEAEALVLQKSGDPELEPLVARRQQEAQTYRQRAQVEAQDAQIAAQMPAWIEEHLRQYRVAPESEQHRKLLELQLGDIHARNWREVHQQASELLEDWRIEQKARAVAEREVAALRSKLKEQEEEVERAQAHVQGALTPSQTRPAATGPAGPERLAKVTSAELTHLSWDDYYRLVQAAR